MQSRPVVVTGANGFVGSHIARALAQAGARVRAVVRRPGSAPVVEGVEEQVGDFADPDFAAEVLKGAGAAVTTVHPNWTDLATRQRVSVEGTSAFARAARDVGVERLVHISTAGVYATPISDDDIDEQSVLVGDDGGDYAVTKRDTELALAQISGITRICVRPPAILGPGETSEFNTILPAGMRNDEANRRINPNKAMSWIHVTDLAALVADLATGRIASSGEPAHGPVDGGWTVVNAAAGRMTARDYVGTVIGVLGVEPSWTAEPVWTGKVLADRAREWGWSPVVDAAQALAELAEGLRSAS